MDEIIENITSTLDLDDSVRILLQLTLLDVALCKEILEGRSVNLNLALLPLISDSYYKIFNQVDCFISNSFLADTLYKYRNTRDAYIKLVGSLTINK